MEQCMPYRTPAYTVQCTLCYVCVRPYAVQPMLCNLRSAICVAIGGVQNMWCNSMLRNPCGGVYVVRSMWYNVRREIYVVQSMS
eukprot:8652311-Pyramimonas_sp.AAC.1